MLFLAIVVLMSASSELFGDAALPTAAIQCGNVPLVVEIAADEKSREKGFMHRETIPEGTGMLFVYPKKTTCKLWMFNTDVPLSAAFLDDDGKILEIIHMDKVHSQKIYRSRDKVRYAIEVPLGWLEKNSVQIGQHCTIPEIPSREP